MLDFLRVGKRQPAEFSWLHSDMHAHWLPGIDDGARSVDDSLSMIRMLYDMGYRHLIATPHIMSDLYPNTPDLIREKLRLVRDACRKNGLDIRLDAAAEYLIDEHFEKHLAKYGAMTLPGNRLLVEFGFYQPPYDVDGILFRLATAGYRVILAHPERYAYYHDKLDVLMKMAERGIELQVNLLSLGDHYGKSVRKAAVELINAGKVSYLGTDAHRTDHLAKITTLNASRRSRKILRNYSFRNPALANDK